jgi:hypothetical protein
MRRPGESAMWVVLALAVGLAGCGKKPMAPDPNAALYGIWIGPLTETTQTPAGPEVHQYALQLQIGPRGVGVMIDGAPRATSLDFMNDPELHFTIANGALRVSQSATRRGDIITGSAGLPGGPLYDEWWVARPPLPLATTGHP